jgi:putative membrane protein
MAFLGAIVTFAGRPLYAPHALTTVAWGLTPLQDQQLGGAIMWVPAGVLFVAAILAPLAQVLRTRPPGTALVLGP